MSSQMVTAILTLFKKEIWEHHLTLIKLPIIFGLILVIGSFGGSLYLNSKVELNYQGKESLSLFNNPTNNAGSALLFDGSKQSYVDTMTMVPFEFNYSPNVQYNKKHQPTVTDSEEKQNTQLSDEQSAIILFCMLFVAPGFLFSIIYSLGCLYNDRRDKSILFYRSMPVAESTHVLVKATVAIFLYTGIYLFIGTITSLLVILVTYLTSSTGDFGVILYQNLHWSLLDILQAVGLSAIIVILLSIYLVPLYSWLLLSSAFSKKLPFLTSLLPFGAMFIEKIVFKQSYLFDAVGGYFSHINIFDDHIINYALYNEAIEPSFAYYVGLIALAGAFIGVAIWLRKYRYEIH